MSTYRIIENENPSTEEIGQALHGLVNTYGPEFLACSESGEDVFVILEKEAEGFRLDVQTWDTTTIYHTNHVASVAIGINPEDDDAVREPPDEPEAGELSRDAVINNVLADHAEKCLPVTAQRLREKIEEVLELDDAADADVKATGSP